MIEAEEKEKYRQVAFNLYNYRIAKGWTQERLSNESGVERSKISRIENSSEDFLFSTILRLANALNVNIEAIIDLTVTVPPDFEIAKEKIPKKKT